MGYYVLSLNIPNNYYERYRTYIDRYRTCTHINSKSHGDVVYVQISFRLIPKADFFVERILQDIDQICCGDVEVFNFFKAEPDKFEF